VSARCDLSDLPVEQCACRIHAPKDEPAPSGRGFVARYDGECPECFEEITAGVDLIVHSIMSGYVHVECL